MQTPQLFRVHFSLSIALAVLGLQTIALALVPGPILLTPETLQQLQRDPTRQIQGETSRARASCLQLEKQRFCPGRSENKSLAQYRQLSPRTQEGTLLFFERKRLQAALVWMPVRVSLPPAKLGQEGLQLGPEPQAWSELQSVLQGDFIEETLAERLHTEVSLPDDLKLYFDAERHLGIVTHLSEAGEYAIGVLTVK